MRYSGAFSRFFLNLSEVTQLVIVCISICISLYVYMAVPLSGFDHDPLIFVIPVALSSWFLRGEGLAFCLVILLCSLLLYYMTIEGLNVFSYNMIFYFILALLSLLTIGGLICWQRRALEMAEDAQRCLEEVYGEQQQLSEIKDQFLQSVNHELRTPLTAIYGYLELLLEHHERLNDEMRITFLQHAMQSCDELQLLVNNVLDSMGIQKERNGLFVEQVVVRDNLFEVLERFDPKSVQMHTIEVNIPDYIVVLANAQYLRQVFRNLLSNAFKYVPIGTTIEVSARLYGDVVDPRHASPEICICVKDMGPGIPPSEIHQLFGQFVRLRRDTNGHIRGSGLGLFLSRQFVEAMGGSIWVESEGIEGKGCSFYFTLPCIVRPKVLPLTSPADFLQFRTPVAMN